MPYYAYYATHDLTVIDFVLQTAVYAIVFDIWFYTTHIVLHMPIFWKHIHKVHHEFYEPAPYA